MVHIILVRCNHKAGNIKWQDLPVPFLKVCVGCETAIDIMKIM